MTIGFSTGALAKGDFNTALNFMQNTRCNAVELSALREDELEGLISSLPDLELGTYDYVSFHAPSKLQNMNEAELLTLLKPVFKKGLPIIVHPDIITDYSLWLFLGDKLFIENMDKRKPIGRSCSELVKIFENLPDASFCFDIAHAQQVDPTMSEAYCMITKFRNRLKEIHISSVNTESKHEAITFDSCLAFRKVAPYLPEVPIIIESLIDSQKIDKEIDLALTSLRKESHMKMTSNFSEMIPV